MLNSLSNSQIEESNADDTQTHSPSTPQTPPYSATSCGGGSDHSVFAPVFIGGGGGGPGSTYSGPSPTTPIHSTPPTPPHWSAHLSHPSTPPPLPPRTMRPRNSTSMSSDVSSPRSRFAPSFMTNSYEDHSPPPLPPRCQTFSTLPRNSSHSSGGVAQPSGQTGHHVIQRLNSEALQRRNSAQDLPIAQPQPGRRYSQSGHHLSGGPMSPPPPPPSQNVTSVFPPMPGPCPQLPPKTYRQTLNNIAR